MLQKSSMSRTVEVFFICPTREFTLKDVSRSSKLAHTSTKQNLRQLVKLGLINCRMEKKGKRAFPLYRANRNKQFIQYKKLYNLTAIIESGIIEFIEERLMPNCLVLFGSYQRGEDLEDSDIDLFIEAPQKNLDLKPFKTKLNRNLELHFREHFLSYPSELRNNIINGSILMGFLVGYND